MGLPVKIAGKISPQKRNRGVPKRTNKPNVNKSDTGTKVSFVTRSNDTSAKTTVNLNVDTDTLTNYHRLKRDGRKTPNEFKLAIGRVSTPSQLSVGSYSEYYNIPEGKFHSSDDVFRYRGYKKIAKIDEGAFGIVSKARRLYDGNLFAVKEVDLRKKRAKRIQEMRRELFVLQRVENKFIVKLIEHFIVGNLLVIIMELCEGSNLTTHLKDGSISELEAVNLFKQMATSIKVLHRRGIAHRDVKLNNFLLDASKRVVKISDFGLSIVSYRKSRGLLAAKTYCGTEPYMAPEILRRNSSGLRCYNPFYADLWSLGVCLYAMITRTFPFKIQTNQDSLLKAQLSRKWRYPRNLRENLSEELRDLTWHLLDPEPGRRISINDVILHPWLNGRLHRPAYLE